MLKKLPTGIRIAAAVVLVAAVLCGAYFMGSAPANPAPPTDTQTIAPQTMQSAPEQPDKTPEQSAPDRAADAAADTDVQPEQADMQTGTAPQKTPAQTQQYPDAAVPDQDPLQEDATAPEPEQTPEDTNAPQQEQNAADTAVPEPVQLPADNGERTCTFSISCATLLTNSELLDPEKRELIPDDGWIFAPAEVVFYEGETVFNLLLRVCKQNRIPMEYTDTPLYDSSYIEGIYNLYEFDAGSLSGWMYAVNGEYLRFGCSEYELSTGDTVSFVYTCDLGKDVGDSYNLEG